MQTPAQTPFRILLRRGFVISITLCGCTSHERYVIERSAVDSLVTPRDGVATPRAIAAIRERDRRPVYVKSSALRRETLTPHGPDSYRVEARAINPMITAGSILTWVGTAISLTGTVLLAVGKVQDNNPLFQAGGIAALSAEPLMWTGTGLWIGGALRRPYEVPPPPGTP